MRATAITLCLLAGLAAQTGGGLVTRPAYVADARAGQGAGCQAAVARVQKAVTAEAYAYADARRTMCQFLSLPEDARAGRPQAINDSMQRKLEEARKETAAAHRAASGCNTSGVKRPQVFEHSAKGSVDAYIACLGSPADCSKLSNPYEVGRCQEEDRKRREAREPICEGLLERLDCEGVRVVEENKQPEVEEEEVVTVPDDLSPECRDAYLQLRGAEREYERARKRERELASNFGAAGPRGTEMYRHARADVQAASEKKVQAGKKLEACKALDEAQPAAGGAGPARVGRPCSADEAAAFARMTGSFHSYRMNVSIGGSCEQATGTYRVAEWCEGVDETYNATTPRVTGTFTGRMEGGSLSLSWEQPASPHHPGGKGTGSCSPGGDGTFSCRGFGCENRFKRQ